MRNSIASLAAGLALAVAGPAFAANLLSNGSFEAGPALGPDGSARGVLPTGWQALGGFEVPDIIGPTYTQSGAGFLRLLPAEDGDRFLDMNGAGPKGVIFQNVTSGLTAGDTVTLNFWAGQWAQNSSGTLTASLFDLTTLALIATRTLTFAYDPNAQRSAWQQFDLSGVLLSDGLIVMFAGDSDSNSRGAPGLDNVSLTDRAASAVPEPAGWATMLLGFGVMGAALRRRRGVGDAAPSFAVAR